MGFPASIQDAGFSPISPEPAVCYPKTVRPTVFRYKQHRFFFFSREEMRRHVHVESPDGECKFWLEPVTALADNQGLSPTELQTNPEDRRGACW
jgi:hypothetical protein